MRSLRLLRGLSVETLSEQSGVSIEAIRDLEEGHIENVPITAVMNLVRFFDVSPIALLG
jgi:transcriptional regulator with XRE-family HTH domain